MVKKKASVPTTWSEVMLKEFLDHIYAEGMVFDIIPLLITEKSTSIYFYSDEPTSKSMWLGGFLSIKGLEDVRFGLNPWEEETENSQKLLGYIELINGSTERGLVPLIRGFIKPSIELFETVDVLIRDARIFKSNDPIILNIHVDNKDLASINTADLLNKKIGITGIEIEQDRVSIMPI